MHFWNSSRKLKEHEQKRHFWSSLEIDHSLSDSTRDLFPISFFLKKQHLWCWCVGYPMGITKKKVCSRGIKSRCACRVMWFDYENYHGTSQKCLTYSIIIAALTSLFFGVETPRKSLFIRIHFEIVFLTENPKIFTN